MIFNQEMNEDENINEETIEGQEEIDMNSQENLETEEIPNINLENTPLNETDNSKEPLEEEPPIEEAIDENLSEEDTLDNNENSEELSKENKEQTIAMKDYLSPEILEVREVKEEDLIDANQEEKFELNQDLLVNISKNTTCNFNLSK